MSDFSEWLQDQLDERGWRQKDLVNSTGIYSSYITHILQNKHLPRPKFCRSIARGLDLQEEVVFLQAGHLSPKNYSDSDLEYWTSVFSQLSIHDQQELIEYARFKLLFKQPLHKKSEPV